jgi:hypothetical protein
MPPRGDDAARLMELLGLSEYELLEVLDLDALSLVSGELDHRPELPILLDLLREPTERFGPNVLRRWVRARGADGRPIEMLTSRDFGRFEDAVLELSQRGFMLGG